ncbi:MAG TPA: isopeptide-forming domain-containing fimbrial protein [Actinomycetaceae bacterium]|nr:isopeptide-forming domain-containing fimbrial protein [Actinomycetaceae bacterium]
MGSLFASPPALADEWAPSVSIGPGGEDGRTGILAGQDATYTLSIRNDGDEAQFNTSVVLLVPNDVILVDSALGVPVVYESGAALPDASNPGGTDSVPTGYQVWVFENVADLPVRGVLNPTLTVRPKAGTFPAGTELDIDANVYTSSNPNLLPSFPGSTGVATNAEHTSKPGLDDVATPVKALRIHKSEPSPESELLRGIHNNTTTYTLRVEYSGEGETTGVTVVDYLPAGLEYLGGGMIDNTQDSSVLFNGNREYEGAASLAETPVPNPASSAGLEELSVDTLELNEAQAAELGLSAGVYTKVTWKLPDLSGGGAQNWDTAAGTPGEYLITYRAGIPLYENTVSFDVEKPSAESLQQAANLNNNNGPSTRHSQGDGTPEDARALLNAATVSGTYGGLVPDGTDRLNTDTDTEVVDAVDLHILKGVDTGTFVTGALATYTLDVRTSEYTSATGISVLDEIGNGLCPAIPTQTPASRLDLVTAGGTQEGVASEAWHAALAGLGSGCAYPSGQAGASITGATVTAIIFDQTDGTFQLLLAIDDMDAQTHHQITYTARQNEAYLATANRHGPTSSGDSVSNYVQIEGTTHPIDAIKNMAEVGGSEDVWEDSEASIHSTFSALSKKVLERDATIPNGDIKQATAWVDADDNPFITGDDVWYRLEVTFPTTIDTRNPVLTDFLPRGVELRDGATFVYEISGTSEPIVSDTDPVVVGNRMEWTLGVPRDGSPADLFVPAGTVLTVYVPATVTGLSTSKAEQDMPQNLAKYRQEDSDGEVFFLRDDAEITLHYGTSLLKGVQEVDGNAGLPASSQEDVDGTQFNSDRDGIEVVQGEDVTYRIDVTSPNFATTELVVWDVLPAGISKSDVAAESFGVSGIASPIYTAQAYAPGDPGRPAVGSDFDGRAVVVFTITSDIPANAELTLNYDVRIPETALITQEYDNTAGIASYEAKTNRPGGDATVTYIPDGPFVRDPAPGENAHVVPGENTYDDSMVYLPGASVTKERISTEIPSTDPAVTDTNNGTDQIVQGEYVTFDYSVTIPANTSVKNGELADDGVFRYGDDTVDYELASVEVIAPTTLPDGFSLDASDGTLTFPETYDTGSEGETFTLRITVWVADRDASDPTHTPNLGDSTTLMNTASFTHEPPTGGTQTWSDTAQVTYIEPDLGISKSAGPDDEVAIGTPVTYTVTVTNQANRPTVYDNTVVDTVPAGLTIDEASVAASGGTWDPTDRTITWTIDLVAGGQSLARTYTATINPDTGGAQTYTNEVDVTGYTLPSTLDTDPTKQRRGDRTAKAEETITAVDAGITKGVQIAGTGPDAFGDSTTVPVGETVEYEVEITLEPNINYWDPIITDTLPAGIQIIDTSISGPTATVDAVPETITGTWSYTLNNGVPTWTYDGDITSSATGRTLVLTYEALVTDADGVAANRLDNTAEFSWNRVNGDNKTREKIDDDATVNLVHPNAVITKTVNDLDADQVEPGETFTYRLTVTNTGDTAAHNLVVTDTVPAGLVVNPSSISNGGVLTGATASGGGTITWDHSAANAQALNGPLYEAGSGESPTSIALSYQARLAASEHIAGGDEFTNTTRVTEWESFEDGGRSYGPSPDADAVVTPAFPELTLAKALTGTEIAYANKPFSWTLTATNTGDSAMNKVVLTDTLPANWAYTSTTSVTVAGTPWAGTTEPGASGQDLTWTFEDTPVLLPNASIVVTFVATPGDDALANAGVGATVAHTNTLAGTFTDVTNSPRNKDGDYTGPGGNANAYIHSADLQLTKAAGSLTAGQTGTGWTVTVKNNGPDTAVGPFTVFDTTGALPEGVTITGVTGNGWNLTKPVARGTDGITTFELERTNTADTLDSGASFPEINVQVAVAANVLPATVDNSATVTSTGTHDPNPNNNEDEDPLPITTSADLTIQKVVNTAEPNAGESITWQLNPSNLGTSVSQSTAENPITITDVVPAGITGVNVVPGTDWTAAASDGFPADEGETITFTYTGTAMPVGPAGSITLTGTIDPFWPANTSITNTAVITPGDTPDPNAQNNTSSVPVTPGTETAIAVSKTRVAWTGTDWVSTNAVPVAGETFSYLVVVTNLGPADASSITVVDELPGYLDYDSFEDVLGDWSRTSTVATGDQDFALTDPSALAPGESASFVITVTLASDHVGDVDNAVEASSPDAPTDPRDEDSTGSQRDADLTIVKTHTGDATAGGTLPYTLTVTNLGPSSSSGPIYVEDILPAGFSYVVDSATVEVAGGTATAQNPELVTPSILEWTIGDSDFSLASGQTIVVTFTAAIAANVPAQTGLVNAAEVDGPEDSNKENNRDTDPTTVVTHADMSVEKNVEPGPWVAGTEITYSFTITNSGPSVANAMVTDLWPTGLTGVSISGTGWNCEGDSCTYANHPVGTGAATTLTVKALLDSAVTPGTDLINTAELGWTDSRGPHKGDDTATITTSSIADLGLVKTAVDEDGTEITEAIAGEQTRFRIDVTSHGPSLAAAPITVTDTLPPGLTFVGLADSTYWTASVDAGDPQVVTFVLGNTEGQQALAAGAKAPPITLIVQVDANLPATGGDVEPLVNTARVTSPTPEPAEDPNPNEDDAPLKILQNADLGIVKSHEAEIAEIGEELVFDLLVTNHGPSVADGVSVTDTIPAGLTYVDNDGSDAAWTQVGDAVVDDDGTTTVTFTLTGTLGVGANAPALSITTLVTPAAYPSATNVANVEGNQPEPENDPNPNEATDLVPVAPDADLTISKVTLTESPHAGRDVTWQITPENLGPAVSQSTSANPIRVTDTLPAGVSNVRVDAGTDWSAVVEGGVVTLTYIGADAMPVGATAPVTITATIDSSFVAGDIENTAVITPGTTPDRDPTNNDDSTTDPVGDATSLDVEKRTVDPETGLATDDDVEIVPGTTVTYEITVENASTADARGVTLADTLPAGLTYAGFANVDPSVWTSVNVAGDTVLEFALTGTLVAGNTATVRITADIVDDLTGESVTNAVTAGATNVPEDEWPDDSATDPLVPKADLAIVKSHAGAAVAGAELQYTLLVTNNGPSVTPEPIVITDVLPAGMSYVADSANVSVLGADAAAAEPVVDGQELTWSVDTTLPVDGTILVTFNVEIAADVPSQTLVNAAEVEGPILDEDPTNNEDDDPTKVTELTGVTIEKTVIVTGPFTAGTEVDFELTVTVTGPSIARDVVISDVLPDGLSLVSIGSDGDGWAWTDGVGTRDTLGLGNHTIPVTALIDQAVPAGTTLVNTGVIEWTDSEGPKQDDDPEDVPVVTDGDLSIIKTAVDANGKEIANVIAGTELRYTLEATNFGPSQVVPLIEITDTLPDGVAFVGIVGEDGGWSVFQDGSTLSFRYPLPLASGQSAPALTIATQVTPDLPLDAELVNVAQVESIGTDKVPGTPDSNPENNEDDATVTVQLAADLAIEKTHQGQAVVGEELTFRLAVTNFGPSEASGVVVVDALPVCLTYVSAAGEGWQVTTERAADRTTTVTATFNGTLAPGEDAPLLKITVLVEEKALPAVTNVATVSANEPDPNQGNNESTDPVSVTEPAKPDPGKPDPGKPTPLPGTGAAIGGAAGIAIALLLSGMVALLIGERRRRAQEA